MQIVSIWNLGNIRNNRDDCLQIDRKKIEALVLEVGHPVTCTKR
jgi:hypothetical protein